MSASPGGAARTPAADPTAVRGKAVTGERSVKLGVNFAWHVHPWEDLLVLVRRAEELGYSAAFIDGDTAMLTSRKDADTLDGWTATTALVLETSRIEIGSLRLVHFWNAARLAQSVASLERIAPGRLRFLISIGDRSGDDRFGLPLPPVSDRIEWLDETLTATRSLWRGDCVTLRGKFLELEEARVRPIPRGGHLPVAIAAARPRMLELVATHADSWDINLPAIPKRVREAEANLSRACSRLGRDPTAIERSQLLFCRTCGPKQDGVTFRAAALAEYRRLNPWFSRISDDEIEGSLVLGERDSCQEQLVSLAASLRLDLPVVDLSGLALVPSLQVLEDLAPILDSGEMAR